VNYRIDRAGDLFVGATSGEADVEDFRRMLDEMLSHPEWTPGSPWLHDHTELDAGALTVNEIKRIADLCAERSSQFGSGKCAIVAGRDLEFGLARMWAVYVEDRWSAEPNVFRSKDEALDWLSVRAGR
jgi:hypothetical protein